MTVKQNLIHFKSKVTHNLLDLLLIAHTVVSLAFFIISVAVVSNEDSPVAKAFVAFASVSFAVIVSMCLLTYLFKFTFKFGTPVA